jgi:hypothetical protein
MSVKVIDRKLNARKVTIKLIDGSLIQGKVNLNHNEAVVQRVSDLFTKTVEPFIVVFDVKMESKSDQVFIVNKHNVVWVSPQDDQVAETEESPGSLLDRLRSA